MSQQTYPVACECGKVHQCPAGYAGTRMQCPCGRMIDVPSLSDLRSAAAAADPDRLEHQIASKVANGELPSEPDCALCGCMTGDKLTIHATCDSADPAVPLPPAGCLAPFLGIFGTVAYALVRHQQLKVKPRARVQLQLAIRMCAKCASEVSSWDVIRKALRRTPVYARLLKRYPGTGFSTIKG